MLTVIKRPVLTASAFRKAAITASVAIGCMSAMWAQNPASLGAPGLSPVPPVTDSRITPPEGSTLFLAGHALGTQGYVCLPKGEGASWTVKPARPEATLFTPVFGQSVQIITHFLSPDTHPNENAPNPVPFGSATWQSSFDSSRVWAQAVNFVPPGNDASCPDATSINCLLLQSIGTQEGVSGGKLLVKTTYVQRLNTRGGSAPADGCALPADIGKQALVPYSADYYFYTTKGQ